MRKGLTKPITADIILPIGIISSMQDADIFLLQSRIANIKEEKISGENVYLFLHYYGTMYKEFTDAEKKRFLNIFIESIEIFKEEQPDGRLLKCINFKFPVFYDGDENVTHICWDSETTVECVALLTKSK